MPLVIIGLSLVSLVHLRDDLRYAMSSRTPAPLAELRGAGQPYEGRYVTVQGIPDRRNALYVETRGDKTRETFFRLLDASPPLFVRARDTIGRDELAARWSGRLRRFSEVPFASSLRDYFARGVTISRGIDLSAFRTALAGAPDQRQSLRDQSGRPLRLEGPDALIEIEVKPQGYLLEMPHDKFPKRDDAQHELERVLAPFGVQHLAASPAGITRFGPQIEDPDVYRFFIPTLEHDVPKRNQLFAALEGAGIEFSLDHPRGKVRFGDLAFSETTSALSIVSAKWELPFGEVVALSVEEPLRIDEDALVLTEGEAPASFVWAPLVAALLLALVVWNVWYLFRPRRRT